MNNKRGELTSSQIITLVIVIAGFIIVLIFLRIIFDDGIKSDREICRLSVLTRATTPDILQAQIPLRCTTMKTCVSYSGKKDACPQFLGEDNVLHIKLKKANDGDVGMSNRIKNIKEIQKLMADNMYFCWSMMGKGKMDLFGSAFDKLGLNHIEPTCVICDRIAFSEDLDDLVRDAMRDFPDYLQKTPFSSSNVDYRNYIEAFTDREMSAYPRVEDLARKVETKNETETKLIGNKNQFAIVYSQIKVGRVDNVLKNWGSVMFTTAVGTPGGFHLKAATSGAIGLFGVSGAVNTYFNRQTAAAYCGKVVTQDKSAEDEAGCSMIQIVGYNVQDINNICGSIQGNP